MDVPQNINIKNKIIVRSRSPTSRYTSKRIKIRDMCVSMFTAALFTIAHRWTQSTHPSIDERTKKTQYSRTTEYYSASKNKENLSYATTWMKLEGLCQGNKPVITRQILYASNYKSYLKQPNSKKHSRMADTRGWEEGEKEAIGQLSVEFRFCKEKFKFQTAIVQLCEQT